MADLSQRSLAGGELGPAVYGRADQIKYQTGLRTLRNAFVHRHGGVSNRTGTQFICEASDNVVKHRSLTFIFNAEQTYVLLFGNQTMRVVRNGVLLTVSGVVAYNGGTAYVPGDLASLAGVNYYCHTATTGNTPPNVSFWHPMPAGDIYEIPTPYVSADIDGIYHVQSGDVVSLDHQAYDPRELRRTGHTTWVLALASLVPNIGVPVGLGTSGGPAGSIVHRYVVTSVAANTFEESVGSATAATTRDVPTVANPITVSWTAVAGAVEYNIYKEVAENGIYGFIGSSSTNSFRDTNVTPDMTLPFPKTDVVLTGSGNRPSVVGYFDQRRLHANTINDPEKVFGSRSGKFSNFTRNTPLQEDDAVIFTIAGRQVNEVRHLIDIGQLVILTSGGEWVAYGNAEGALTPTTPGLKQVGYHGASIVPPIIVGNNILYVQARGNFVRDFRTVISNDGTQGFSGDDLTVFAPHLFAGHTIDKWAYAQIPDSAIHAVRSDGLLMVLTYIKAHEIFGWSHYDTFGSYEDVVAVPEGQEDEVYVWVKRAINGQIKRYLERFASRRVTDVTQDALFLDSYRTYDGWNATATAMTLSGGSTWEHTETLTLQSSVPFFVAGDVGNVIVLRRTIATYTPENDSVITEELIRLEIIGFSTDQSVQVNANKTVPAFFRNVGFQDWGKAVDQVSGLGHLEGQTVGILADGSVVTNGIDDPAITIVGGQLSTELERPAVIIHVGLPYVSDVETLDMDSTAVESVSPKNKRMPGCTVLVESSRGMWIGRDDEHLREHKPKGWDADGVLPLTTEKIEMNIEATWEKTGRIFIRQRDPLPLTVLAVYPWVEMGN